MRKNKKRKRFEYVSMKIAFLLDYKRKHTFFIIIRKTKYKEKYLLFSTPNILFFAFWTFLMHINLKKIELYIYFSQLLRCSCSFFPLPVSMVKYIFIFLNFRPSLHFWAEPYLIRTFLFCFIFK